MHLYVSQSVWSPGCLDPLLRQVADDVITRVLRCDRFGGLIRETLRPRYVASFRHPHRSEDEDRDREVVAGDGGADEGVEDLVEAEDGRRGVGPAAVIAEGAEGVQRAAGDDEG